MKRSLLKKLRERFKPKVRFSSRHEEEFVKLKISILAIFLIFVIGTTGYYIIGYGEWTILDCIYMTVITLSTIGYGEVLDISNRPEARVFTVFLIIFGLGTFTYYLSHLLSYIIEGDLRNFFWNRKMEKIAQKMENHIIVCGAGRTGFHTIKQLIDGDKQVVVIENRVEMLSYLQNELPKNIPIIIGDATDDNVLLHAGIDRAYGLIASLPEDKDNIYVVITAKSLNNKLKVITKSVDQKAVEKFYRVGADHVVSTTELGGMRMAVQMVSPVAVNFIETLTSRGENKHRIEAIKVPESSKYVDHTLGEINLRKYTKALILAYRCKNGGYHFSPDSKTKLKGGMELVVLAQESELELLQNLLNS